MHSTDWENFTFHHNGDFCGDVVIDAGDHEMRVPFEALKFLVHEYYRRDAISKLEQAEGEVLQALISPAMYKDMLEGFQPKHIGKALENNG